MSRRVIFHIDVNSAFLSWEATRRVKNGEADIRLIPSAIGGDKEKRVGIVLAKSIPAKKKGVKTGEPIGLALQKCPNLFVAKPDFLLYERCSKAFMDICSEYSPIVEKYSIDECFMDMSGTEKIYQDILQIAYEIKNKIRDSLGFTVNIGISDSKVLAKMASDFEKPDKIHTLFSNEIETKMWPLEIRNLFSIGDSTAERLRSVGILTIGELANMDIKTVQALVGEKRGLQLWGYSRGIDDSGVDRRKEDAKGYSISTTLEKDAKSDEEVERVLRALADSVASRIRMDSAQASCISVTVRYSNFKDRSHQRSIDEPTDITSEIFNVSKELFDELWDKKTPIRLLGISLTGLIKDGESQLSAFSSSLEKDKARRLDKTIDSLRSQFGSEKIVRGVNYNSSFDVGRKYKAQIKNKTENKK